MHSSESGLADLLASVSLAAERSLARLIGNDDGKSDLG
jgi:hypothetical protein